MSHCTCTHTHSVATWKFDLIWFLIGIPAPQHVYEKNLISQSRCSSNVLLKLSTCRFFKHMLCRMGGKLGSYKQHFRNCWNKKIRTKKWCDAGLKAYGNSTNLNCRVSRKAPQKTPKKAMSGSDLVIQHHKSKAMLRNRLTWASQIKIAWTCRCTGVPNKLSIWCTRIPSHWHLHNKDGSMHRQQMFIFLISHESY